MIAGAVSQKYQQPLDSVNLAICLSRDPVTTSEVVQFRGKDPATPASEVVRFEGHDG